jgi:hypothetical protein
MANRSHLVRKQGRLDIDDDERTDYYNQPLEQSVEDDSPFYDPGTEPKDDPTGTGNEQADPPPEELHVPRTEVPLEDLLTTPKRKGVCSCFCGISARRSV